MFADIVPRLALTGAGLTGFRSTIIGPVLTVPPATVIVFVVWPSIVPFVTVIGMSNVVGVPIGTTI